MRRYLRGLTIWSRKANSSHSGTEVLVPSLVLTRNRQLEVRNCENTDELFQCLFSLHPVFTVNTIDKAALIQLSQVAVIDQFLNLHIRKLRIADLQQQPLHVAQTLH